MLGFGDSLGELAIEFVMTSFSKKPSSTRSTSFCLEWASIGL